MSVEQWWPTLSSSAKEWLVANNGAAIEASIVEQIMSTTEALGLGSGWVGERDSDDFFLSDHDTDWIEAVANDET